MTHLVQNANLQNQGQEQQEGERHLLIRRIGTETAYFSLTQSQEAITLEVTVM